MKKLVTIFNPNDPTPTAMSIRSHNPSEVHVLLVGQESYKDYQRDSLNRFETWISGSMRPVDFPEHIWLPRLDWTSLSDSGTHVHFHRLTNVSDFDISLLDSSTTVDFFSGTKEMGIALMTHCQSSSATIGMVGFTVTQLTGSIVDIVSGQESEPYTNLSIRERVWLSAGKIALTGSKGSAEIGEEIKNWESSLSGKKKLMPHNQDKLATILGLEGKERDFINEGYWLEHFSSNVIATWPDVVETWAQLHVIPRSWSSFVAACFSKSDLDKKKLGYPHDGVTEWPYGFDNKGRRNRVELPLHIKWSNDDQKQFLATATLDESQLNHLWDFAFINDVDVVALLENGFYIFVECKHMNKSSITKSPSNRVHAISSAIAPRSSIPVVVYSGTTTNINDDQGVVVIKWPDLANPLIGIDSTNRRKLALFLKTDAPNTLSNVQIADPTIAKERQNFADKIGKILADSIEGSSCTWMDASKIISNHTNKTRKKKLFGSPKFGVVKARTYLREYVTITGEGNEAIVEPLCLTKGCNQPRNGRGKHCSPECWKKHNNRNDAGTESETIYPDETTSTSQTKNANYWFKRSAEAGVSATFGGLGGYAVAYGLGWLLNVLLDVGALVEWGQHGATAGVAFGMMIGWTNHQ